MKDLSRLKIVTSLIKEFETQQDERADTSLEENVRSSTEGLLRINPEITLEEITKFLILSACESYKIMITQSSLNLSIKSIINIINAEAEKNRDDKLSYEEESILKYMIKNQIVVRMVNRSFAISLKAATEAWNGMKGMES